MRKLLLLFVLFVAACGTTTTERLKLLELPVVAHVDVDRYVGTWYEIASFPQSFQEGCTETTATYKLRDDGELDVINHCIKDDEEDVAEGRARIVDKTTNAKLEVSFFRPFWGDYWIIDLADDYSWAVVGHPSRDYLWILSRTPQMATTTYDGIIKRLKANGYVLDRLKKTQQTSTPDTKTTAVEPEVIDVKPEPQDPPETYLGSDSDALKIAQRLIALDLTKTHDPASVLKALELPVEPLRLIRPNYQTKQFKTHVDSPGGQITAMLIFKTGTWEPPRGNSMPRSEPPVVEGVALSGPNGLKLELPDDAKPMVFDVYQVREFQVWNNYHYFEQGTAEHGWMLANYPHRAPFHRTMAEVKVMEDALITLTDSIAKGATDLQVVAAREFAEHKVEDNVYDFGSGSIKVTYPTGFSVEFVGPTRLARWFKRLDVLMITTSFANDAGQMVNAIELDGFTVRPGEYYINDQDNREAEMGLAAEAYFSSLAVDLIPGQKRGATVSRILPSSPDVAR